MQTVRFIYGGRKIEIIKRINDYYKNWHQKSMMFWYQYRFALLYENENDEYKDDDNEEENK